MLKLFLCLLAFALCLTVRSQSHVSTADIDRFWIAYDSARTTTDTVLQEQYLQRLYIDPGTEGLKAFMKLRQYDAALYVKLIDEYPKFWNSVRANTLRVKNKTAAIEKGILMLKALYPDMQPATMYFTIGGLRSGGTTSGSMVLIGTEIAAADSTTDASELSSYYQTIFRHQNSSRLVELNVHEYVHTQQQQDEDNTLLGKALQEGGADFIAGQATTSPNTSPYMIYGRQHDTTVKAKFKAQMYTGNIGQWFYNGKAEHPDLGYYIGYCICREYYRQAKNKTQAIKDIIRVDYGNDTAADRFLLQSGYFHEKIDKSALLAAYAASQPTITSLTPDINHHTDVDTSLTTLTLVFSEPMGAGVSISYAGGQDQYPILNPPVGFSPDHRSFSVKLALKPAHHYSFLVTGRSFASQNGYPLKEYPVDFTTK